MTISHDVCTPFLSATLLNIENPPITVDRLRREMLNQLKNATGGGIARAIHEVKDQIFRDGGVDVGWIHYSETRSPAWYDGGGDLNETRHHSIFIVKKGAVIALAFSDPTLRNTFVADIRKRQGQALPASGAADSQTDQ
jgi:hypothetical protein